VPPIRGIYVEPSLALRTQRRYREIVEHDLVPLIGRLPLQRLRPSHVITLEQRLRASGNRKTGAGLGPAAVQKVHSVLHRAMAHAVRWQALPVNPVDAVDRPAVPQVEVQVLTPEQARLLLQALRGMPRELALRVALLCGLRLSELLALRWGEGRLRADGHSTVAFTLATYGLIPGMHETAAQRLANALDGEG
jgi:integrase